MKLLKIIDPGLVLFLLGVAILWFGMHQAEVVSSVFDQVCSTNSFGRSNCDEGKVPLQFLEMIVVVSSFSIPVALGCILGVKLKRDSIAN